MNEDRKRILELLAEGKITADEAERLIAALAGDGPAPTAEASRPSRQLKYLRVVVDAGPEPEYGQGPTKVNIRVPMQLLRAGVRLGALLPAHAREQVNSALHAQGIDFDIGKIKPENLEDLIEQLGDFSVDVDDERAKVRVFCE
jgi:hypothetical protein